MSEVDLGKDIIAYLEEAGWDIYQEVETYGRTADIVAVRGNLLWIVELKRSFGLAVLEQARFWRSYAHMVSIATPPRSGRSHWRSWEFEDELFRWLRVGWLVCPDGGHIREKFRPPLNRQALTIKIRTGLRPEHKIWAEAGNAEGKRYTPWSRTFRELAQLVKTYPRGLTVAGVLAKMDTHYASAATARGCLIKWVDLGRVPGVRLEREGRTVKFYPSGETGSTAVS